MPVDVSQHVLKGAVDEMRKPYAALGPVGDGYRDGLDIGEQTHASLRHILTSIDQTSEAISQIAADARQQADTVEQINIGLSQISAVVQTNSATAEQSASSSQEMAAPATFLNEMISRYVFGDEAKKFKGKVLLTTAS
jgi:methyl-accepting chemotaxis protein